MDLLAIAAADPTVLPLWAAFLFAFGMYPVGMFFGCNSCCDPCPECSGSTCCGGDYPRTIGVCCEDVWRMPTDPGKCCDGVWYTSEEPGDCCGGVWYPTPSGVEPPPNVFTYPFTPVSWETEQCPEGSIYARRGDFGQCCGCIPDLVWDARANEGTGGFVATVDVLSDVCCDACEPTLYLPFDSYGSNIGCLGTCCADEDCSRLPASQCNEYNHPTHPGLPATAYLWRSGPCCGPEVCLTECCDGADIVEKATFEVTGTIEGENVWTLTIGETTVERGPFEEFASLEDIADSLAYGLSLAGIYATHSGTTITVIGDGVSAGTITPPGGDPTPPTSTATKLTFRQCSEIGGTPATAGKCPCQSGAPCCETARSSGLGLTFHKPATLSGTVRVTVTGATNSPILVHGTLFGADATPSRRCPFTHTFLLCRGSFNIEPQPCGTSFYALDVEVCYEAEETAAEPYTLSPCNGITVWLGSCPDACVTTMTYAGAGLTSNASLVMTGDAVILANGTGPLVLTSNITHQNTGCSSRVLTLSGTNTDANKITGEITDPSGLLNLAVRKDGSGTWWFTRDHSFNGVFSLLDGTAVVSATVLDIGGDSPLGSGSTIYVGSGTATSGTASLLLHDANFDKSITVEAGSGQRVLIGLAAGATSGIFRSTGNLELHREVTLVAPAGGSVRFGNYWFANDNNVRVGTPSYTGIVRLSGPSKDVGAGTVTVEFGQLNVISGRLSASQLKVDSSELKYDSTTALTSPLAFVGSGGKVSGTGTVKWTSLDVTGDGHEISAKVALDAAAVVTGDGDALISGVMSGTASLTMDGTGTVSFSGDNTRTGTTTINSGTLRAESLTAFGTGDIVVNAGGTLDKNGYALANTITNNGGTVIP